MTDTRSSRTRLQQIRNYFSIIDRRRSRRGTPDGGPPRTHLVRMIVGTYREMPGLSVSLDQAARLFGVGEAACRAVLEFLVTQGRLQRMRDGQYTAR